MDKMFSRRGRSPYAIGAGLLFAALLALAVEVIFFAPPWWAR